MAGTAADANQTRSGILPGDCFTGLAHLVVWAVPAAGNTLQASCADAVYTTALAS